MALGNESAAALQAASQAAQVELDQADVHGHINALWVYPVKSCAGIAVEHAELTATGLAHDREWMVVDANGDFLTQRSHPRMVLIAPQLVSTPCGEGVTLVLRAPGIPEHTVQPVEPLVVSKVTVWKDVVQALDQGDAVAQWLSQFLGTPCRLVRFDPAQQRACSRTWTGADAARTQFADGYPLLITTQAAGDALNERIKAAGGPEVDLLRFRANVVLQGLAAHEEDHLSHLLIATGEGLATLRPVKPCTRCPIPDIDPATAVSSHDVGDALAAYRADARMDGAITFGMNAIATQGTGQVLRVGQPVGGVLAFD